MPSPISRITFFAFFFDSDCFGAWVRSCSTRRAPPYSLEFATGLAVEQRRIVLARLGRLRRCRARPWRRQERGRGDNRMGS